MSVQNSHCCVIPIGLFQNQTIRNASKGPSRIKRGWQNFKTATLFCIYGVTSKVLVHRTATASCIIYKSPDCHLLVRGLWSCHTTNILFGPFSILVPGLSKFNLFWPKISVPWLQISSRHLKVIFHEAGVVCHLHSFTDADRERSSGDNPLWQSSVKGTQVPPHLKPGTNQWTRAGLAFLRSNQ